ncbi:hypothetical protein O3Q51_12900 [Cryomorphaceae bacterium 1068]|nr:hypothetical protein [Cryomorphaceae bacterium 1068]
MNPILRNILAFVLGAIIGGIVNMAIVTISPSVFPLPEGFDPNDVNTYAEHIDDFSYGNFFMTFLAHALGTLVGALIAVKVAATHKVKLAYAIGVFTMLGGIAAVFMIPAPTWFIAVDLLLAYIPMAWLASKTA